MPDEAQEMIDSGLAEVVGGQDSATPPASTPPTGVDPTPPTPPTPPATPPGGDPTPPADSSSTPPTPPNYLMEVFGEEIDVTTAKERWSETRKQAEEWKRQKEILELKLKDSANFATPEIKSFNSFVKATNIDNFNVYKRIKETDAEKAKLNPIEVLVTSEIIQNPQFAHKESYFRKEVLRKYGLESEAEFAELDNDELRTRIEIDAARALSAVEEMKSKIDPEKEVDYEAQLTERKARSEAAKATLGGIVEKMRPTLGKFVFADTKEGGSPFEYDFDQKTVDGIVENVINQMAEQDNPYDEETFRQIVGAHYQNAVANNLPNILKAFASSIRQMTDEEFRLAYSRPSGVGDNPAREGKEISGAEAAYNAEMARFGGMY